MTRLEEKTKRYLENIRIKNNFFREFARLQSEVNKAMDRYLAGEKEAMVDIERARKEVRDFANLFNAYYLYLYDWDFESRRLIEMGLDD